ncbi:MAG TPA: dihydroorotate dehydrogenase-like protein [Bryobacteraceae bacterium]|nr:dihydroorotate dehydrogenase-like protein [Bryobacteraceae bacterium]
MPDLSTSYLGLKLRSPLVASSSPLCKSVDNLCRLEDAGASAIVLHSLFEEQINLEAHELDRWLEPNEGFAEAQSYLPDLTSYNIGPEGYVEHIASAKRSVRIPVIGSLNGVSSGGWIRYARLIEQAGADALELNIYYLPTNPSLNSSQVEMMHTELVEEVKGSIRIPVAVKLGPYFSATPNMMMKLDRAGANGLVLFNRFYQPDFDLENLEVIPNLALSNSSELLMRLHWVAVLYGQIKADMAITGGVHTAEDVVKSMMAGAKVAMMTSALLRHGITYLAEVKTKLVEWLDEHEYESITEMQGSMSRRAVADPEAFERANYMRVLSSYV